MVIYLKNYLVLPVYLFLLLFVVVPFSHLYANGCDALDTLCTNDTGSQILVSVSIKAKLITNYPFPTWALAYYLKDDSSDPHYVGLLDTPDGGSPLPAGIYTGEFSMSFIVDPDQSWYIYTDVDSFGNSQVTLNSWSEVQIISSPMTDTNVVFMLGLLSLILSVGVLIYIYKFLTGK